jgi:hypothetical protein
MEGLHAVGPHRYRREAAVAAAQQALVPGAHPQRAVFVLDHGQRPHGAEVEGYRLPPFPPAHRSAERPHPQLTVARREEREHAAADRPYGQGLEDAAALADHRRRRPHEERPVRGAGQARHHRIGECGLARGVEDGEARPVEPRQAGARPDPQVAVAPLAEGVHTAAGQPVPGGPARDDVLRDGALGVERVGGRGHAPGGTEQPPRARLHARRR